VAEPAIGLLSSQVDAEFLGEAQVFGVVPDEVQLVDPQEPWIAVAQADRLFEPLEAFGPVPLHSPHPSHPQGVGLAFLTILLSNGTDHAVEYGIGFRYSTQAPEGSRFLPKDNAEPVTLGVLRP